MGTVVCVVGFGRVGSVTADILRDEGFEVLVYDSSMQRVEEAKSLGFKAYLSDAASASSARIIASNCEVVATSLPSRIAERALRTLMESGAKKIVDVSYIRDPFVYDGLARRSSSLLLVDAGVAPGLTNILATHIAKAFSEPLEVIIHVGGLSARESTLGLVASWNMEDMLEEYTRPARTRMEGKYVELDPILDATTVEIPGIGVFDALPTDGLRTLLKTLSSVPILVEYTLRYKGHVELFRMLKQLELLSSKNYVVEGCSITPRTMLAKLLEDKLPKKGDRIIIYVKGVGKDKDGNMIKAEYILDVGQDDLGIGIPVLSYMTGFMQAWFTQKVVEGFEEAVGVVPPERFVNLLPEIIERLKERGITLERRVCIEEAW